MYVDEIVTVLAAAGFVVGFLCALHALMFKTRDASGALVWILFCLLRPVDRRALLRHDRRRPDHRAPPPADRRGARPLSHGPRRGGQQREELAHSQLHALTDNDVVDGNEMDVLVGGKAAYARMLAAIAGAKTSIALQTYILDEDETGGRFRDALVERAQAGVDVRVLYDSIGAVGASRAFIQSFRDGRREDLPVPSVPPVQAALAGQPPQPPEDPRGRRPRRVPREHEPELAPRFGREGRLPRSRGEREGPGGPPAHRHLRERLALRRRRAAARGRVLPAARRRGRRTSCRSSTAGPTATSAACTRSSSRPATRRSSEILVLTPYFIPPLPVLYALETAAARGVKVQLVIPEVTDSKLMDAAIPHFLERVMPAGVSVVRRPGPMLHMKLLLIDDDLAIVGSSNMDARSYFLNFEVDLVIYAGPVLAKLRAVAEKERDASIPVSPDDLKRRPFWRRFLTRIAALFTPVL